MKTTKDEMDEKLERTVEKTIEAIARIQRFVAKYRFDLNKEQLDRISKKLRELQDSL